MLKKLKFLKSFNNKFKQVLIVDGLSNEPRHEKTNILHMRKQ